MNVGYNEDCLLPLSGIQHLAFCERQWALIHIERQWAENQRTVEGRHLHERAHNSFLFDEVKGRLVARAVPVASRTLGLYGQADVVEFGPVGPDEGGISLPGHMGLWLPMPVEYKRGKPKRDDRDEVQLCAQAMCLEEMLRTVIPEGDLYYGQTRRRTHVRFTPDLRQRVTELSRRMHELFEAGLTPPAAKRRHCRLCSLIDVCLPSLTRRPKSVARYIRLHLAETGEQAEE
ncbi:MAG: CRISPR-associated protein Cas4 [Chitinophagales bacterium]